MFKDILLAIDGSDHALKAAHVAGEMARTNNATLRVVVGYDAVPIYLGYPEFQLAVSARMKHAEDVLENAQLSTPDAGTTAHQYTIQGTTR